MIMVQSKQTGAVLLVSGAASFLVESTAEVNAHRAGGVPLIAVGHSQFRRYESVRWG